MTKIAKGNREKILKFRRENTTKRFEKYRDGTEYSYEHFQCPCCEYGSCNTLAHGSDKDLIENGGFSAYLIHLNAQIRLHASHSHIKILNELFGEEVTNEFLRFAIAKNKEVTKELERIYEERTKEIILDLKEKTK